MYALNTAALIALAGLAAAQTTVVSPSPAPQPTLSTVVKNGTVTVTSVYDVYTTYCPGPTSFHLGGKDYTVTEPCTLTITDCPCTVTETHPAGPTWIPNHPGYPVVPGKPGKPEHPQVEKPSCPGGSHCPETPEHPDVEKPGKPGYPQNPEHPDVEKPGKPGYPQNPEHPEVEKPGKPEQPEVEKPGKPGYPQNPEHPDIEKPVCPGGSNCPEKPEQPTTPEQPETSKPSKGEQVPETPVVTAGAGAVQFSLGLAAAFGLMAL